MGTLRDGNCSLVIYNIRQEDEGPYHFRIDFNNNNDRFSFFPVTRLRVSDFTDKPSIFPVETVEGKTWGDKLTYTSVVSLTPALKHHRQNLTCRFRYRTVSSEQTLTLTVQYSPQNLSITSSDKVNKSWVSIKEGNSTAILCSVQSFPASNLTWRHLGVTMNRTSSNNELWLEFPQVTPRLTGVYQCVAENKHGTTERSVTLAIEQFFLLDIFGAKSRRAAGKPVMDRGEIPVQNAEARVSGGRRVRYPSC
ncbi:sialic acid-binding Ig-like lectin 10 [Amblyraja radiata]|uniref:sialic acid-binding Ig-like lectin 10 n=1 Tax=Amblyraja radiata TaxID=386614 RepID=UPI001401C37D|nr:sialic acid-binding Ig-like lectin 10 [Amblyraja radiata]